LNDYHLNVLREITVKISIKTRRWICREAW